MLVQMLLQNISPEKLMLHKYNLSNSYLNIKYATWNLLKNTINGRMYNIYMGRLYHIA